MLRTVDSRWGPCTYLEKDEYVGKSIRYYGEYNPDESEKIISLAEEAASSTSWDGSGKPMAYCLDIGANIGVITMCLLASGHDVDAFEPQPQLFEILQKNCPKAYCYNFGLGDYNGTAKMPKVYYSAKGNFGGLGMDQRSVYGDIDVEVYKLDDTMYKRKIDLIKIDVEGFERKVLIGGRMTIKLHKPIMYIEDDRPDRSLDLRRYIKELGYTIEEHKPLLYRKDNFFKYEKNVWDKPYASHNLICRPC